MSFLTRRGFLKTGSMAVAASAAASAMPFRGLRADGRSSSLVWGGDPQLLPLVGSPEVHAVAAAALEAAKAAGATYADVHFRVTRKEDWVLWLGLPYPVPNTTALVGIGVRALVNGYWGFSGAAGVATLDHAASLGRSATAQAKTAAKGKPRTVELAPTPVVANGRWTMPIEIDPFTVSYEEKADYISGISDYIARRRYGVGTSAQLHFVKEERTFASTEGAFTAQTVYSTSAEFSVGVPRDWLTELPGSRGADFLDPAGAGWEYIRNAPFQDRVDQMIDEGLRARRPKPVEIGRYEVVFDAKAIAAIVDQTVVTATELDRAMGYEANGVGTSFLNDPVGMLGTYKMGSVLLNVTANRSMPGGAATVKWDDEGVEPADTQLVTDGILTDFQTTREAASWVAPYYQKAGKPVRSNGCAGVYGATSALQQFNPNIVLEPGPQDLSFDDLVKTVKKGLALVAGYSWADQQALNGSSEGELVYEINDGKITGTISKAQVMYRSPEFWKGLAALGGKNSVRLSGFERYRDSYQDRVAHTVSAVPAKVVGVPVTDYTRKA